MQCALLDEVTPQLRAVVIDIDNDEEILYSRFYYDGEASEKQIDLWDCAISEAATDLQPEFLLRAHIERLDYPKKIPSFGYFAYLRKECDELNYKNDLHRPEIKEMSIGYALLAVQHAMLGVVTPDLRAVVVDFDKEEPLLYIRFYYSGKVSDKMVSLWESTIKEASVNFGSGCPLDSNVERIDYPGTFPFRGRFAYVRKEA